MRLPLTLPLVLLTLGSKVLADGAAIVSAIETIESATAALNESVATWSGDLLGAIPITVKSAALLVDINKATDTAKQSAELSDLEAFSVGVSVETLVGDTNSTLAEIIAAKPKFEKLLLGPAIYLTLQQEKSASDNFGEAVKEKVPETFVSAAESLIAQLDESFDQALEAYEGVL